MFLISPSITQTAGKSGLNNAFLAIMVTAPPVATCSGGALAQDLHYGSAMSFLFKELSNRLKECRPCHIQLSEANIYARIHTHTHLPLVPMVLSVGDIDGTTAWPCPLCWGEEVRVGGGKCRRSWALLCRSSSSSLSCSARLASCVCVGGGGGGGVGNSETD